MTIMVSHFIITDANGCLFKKVNERILILCLLLKEFDITQCKYSMIT